MGFIEAVRSTQAVNYAAEVKGIGAVAMEAEVVEKAEGFIDVTVFVAELVDFLGPV